MDGTNTIYPGAADQGQRNVLVFTETFLPASEAFIRAQAKAYRRHKPHFLVNRCLNVGNPAPEFQIHETSNSVKAAVGMLALKVPRIGIPRLFQPLRNMNLIHAHFGKNGFVIGPLAKSARLPLITTFHGLDATYKGDAAALGGFNQKRYYRHGRDEMATWNTWNIAVSDFIQSRLLSAGFPPERVFRHYIGIDSKLFKPMKKPRRKGLVVSVARFVDYKGHRFMIDALERVVQQGFDIQFEMVGEGPLRRNIEADARRRLPAVRVHAQLSQAEVRSLLAEAEVYLHGSVTLENGHAEAFGIANLEAQSVGTPVVAFRSGGVGEAVKDGVTGILAEERDVRAMSDAIGKLLSDSGRWTSFSSNARSWVENNFEIARQTNMLEDLYLEVDKQFANSGR